MDFIIDTFLHIDQHLISLVQEYHGWTYAILFVIIFCETGLVVLPFLPGDSLLFVSGAGGCVKTLTQPFFMRKAQTFSSPGFVITQSFRIFRHKVFRYGKVTFLFLHS